MSVEKIGGMFLPACDQCGEELPDLAETHKEAIEAMRAAGWSIRLTRLGWENLCPVCREG